ncbi:hypothetical protein LCGC14_0871880 [marine sediment metagenome]|uniref:ATP-grasp domain-containing protein n=1 Tax=marine sediment metagenome TaxID=412755 RepID=A0A0F9SBD5_9ZZZZ
MGRISHRSRVFRAGIDDMDIKWIVEHDVFDEDLEPLIAEIKRQGMEVEQIKYIPFESGSYNNFPDDACVIFHGSLNLGRQLQRQKPWIPGSFCTLDNFKCSKYYAHYGKYLINQRYVMLPLAELKRRKEELFHRFDPQFEHLPGDPQVFVRPNTGFKTFTGQVLSESNFNKDYEWFEEFAAPDSLVVVSRVQRIVREWRFIIADRKIIAASRYKPDVEHVVYRNALSGETMDNEARLVAERIAKEEWQPDPIYVVDIAKNGFDTYGLMEINSFSCSGFYACPVEPIVREASKLALKEWQESRE